MASLLDHTAQLNALHASLQRLDPQMADALKQHLQACAEAVDVLRECGPLLDMEFVAKRATGQDVRPLHALATRIAALIAPPALPISQADED